MMHAFSAKDEDGGKELFAYVPSLVYSKLPTPTNLDYVHTYTVDGTPAVKDAKINSAWRTVLVSGLGLGGRGVFALDVTDPESVSESTAASTVLWEFPSSADADLATSWASRRSSRCPATASGWRSSVTASTARRAVAPSSSSTWTACGAQALDSRHDYLKLTLDDATATASNGIASVLPADVNGDGTVDFLYAGDLLGNLWKFDVSAGKTDSKWQSPRKPMFAAKDSAGQAASHRDRQAAGRGAQSDRRLHGGVRQRAGMSTTATLELLDPVAVRHLGQEHHRQGTITRDMLSQEQKTLSAGVAPYGQPPPLPTDHDRHEGATDGLGSIRGWYMDLLIGPYRAQLGERTGAAR